MAKSKMLSKELENIEQRFERKFENSKKFSDSHPSETNIKICENCFNALEQVRRLRAIFERSF